MTTPFDPDEDFADDDDAPDANPDPAPPQDGDPSVFEPDLGGAVTLRSLTRVGFGALGISTAFLLLIGVSPALAQGGTTQSPEVTAAIALLALVLTSPGATVAAGIVNRIVEYTKKLGPGWVDNRERFWAIGVTIALVAFAYVVGLASIPPTQKLPWVDPLAFIIGLPLTIYNIARLAMSMADDLDRTPNSIRPQGTNP